MKLLTGKKYIVLCQNSCERVLRWPKRLGIFICLTFLLSFSSLSHAQGFSLIKRSTIYNAYSWHQTTVASITATATGGNWNDPNSWVGAVVPSSGDDVSIPA